jgi:hypothetical protein
MSKTPSIAVIPSGYKASKVYSVLPTNGDADLDFTRNCVATRVNQNGLLEEVGLNVPRLDYSDGGCPSLLLEPQRTNLVTDAIVGDVTNDVDVTLKTVSPSGLTDATIPIAEYTYSRFEVNISIGVYETDDILTYSWYRKRITEPSGTPAIGDLNIRGLVNLESLDVTEQIESDVNGFDRFQRSVKVIDGSLGSSFKAYLGEVIGVGNQSVAYYGHQLELGAYATSLIYTSGSEVTRFQDQASKDNLESYINSSEGVLYAEAKWLISTSFDRISISGASGQSLSMRTSVDNSFQVLLYKDGDIQSQFNFGVNNFDYNNEYIKIAVSYKLNETKLFVNGSQYGATDTTCLMPIGLNDLEVQKGITAKDLRVYNEALTDAELIELTQ